MLQPRSIRASDDDLEVEIDMLHCVFAESGLGRPPLGWDGVYAFEEKHGIILPEPYRTFIAEIADGCDTGPPHYGLIPLTHRHYSQDDDEVDYGIPPEQRFTPSAPFPLTEKWIWEDDVPKDEEEEEEEEEEENPVDTGISNHGFINLGTDGCGMDFYLIVTGAHRGHIWSVSGEGAVPLGRIFGVDKASRPGFAGWVEDWVTTKLGDFNP